MKAGDLLRVTSQFQFDEFQPDDMFFVLSFYSQPLQRYNQSWHKVEMVKIMTRLGVRDVTLSSVMKATLLAE